MRVCPWDETPIPDDAHDLRRYCSDRCRKAAHESRVRRVYRELREAAGVAAGPKAAEEVVYTH